MLKPHRGHASVMLHHTGPSNHEALIPYWVSAFSRSVRVRFTVSKWHQWSKSPMPASRLNIPPSPPIGNIIWSLQHIVTKWIPNVTFHQSHIYTKIIPNIIWCGTLIHSIYAPTPFIMRAIPNNMLILAKLYRELKGLEVAWWWRKQFANRSSEEEVMEKKVEWC